MGNARSLIVCAALGAVWGAAPARCAAPEPARTVFTGYYRETPAVDVIMDMTRAAGLNAILPSPLEANITARIENIPVMDALDMVMGIVGADYRVMDGTLYVVRRGVAARPPAKPASPERNVERIADRIDAEAAAAIRPRPAPVAAEPVRVEVNVQVRPSYPPMPFFPADWPVFGGVVYAPLGGVNQVGWNPRGVTTVPGGIVAAAWRSPRRF